MSNRKKRSKIGALYAGLRTHEEETPTETSPDELATKQVESYKVMAKKSGLELDDDPLVWSSRIFPEVCTVARSYLCMQATSCSSERLFSEAGYIVSKYRTSLTTDNVSFLTFLATNSGD